MALKRVAGGGGVKSPLEMPLFMCSVDDNQRQSVVILPRQYCFPLHLVMIMMLEI